MKRTSFVALALMMPLAARASAPVLSGLYSVGELGLVEFSLVEGKVVGRVKSSAQCVYPPDTQVVSGQFEGGVFVGNVMLCQTGPGCAAQRSYPMMGVAHDDAVSGWVRLAGPCKSPALGGRQLVFSPATPEEKQKVAGESSAAAVAGKDKSDPATQAVDALKAGTLLLRETKFAPAREKFRQAIELDGTRWEAFFGFAVTEVKLGHPERSLENFGKALDLGQKARASPADVAQVHYNRACALVKMDEKKRALVALKTAVNLGGPSNVIDSLNDDPDLNPLRGDDDFKRLLADARARHNRKKPK